MKKIISICLALLSILSIISINAFALNSVGEDTLIIKDDIIEEVYGIYNTTDNADVSLMATGLITSKSLKLAKTAE